MKSFFQAAAILSVAVSALTIPPPSHAPHDSIPGHAVAASTGIPHQIKDGISGLSPPNAGGVNVFFSVPCEACFADADEELEIEMKIDSSEQLCQSNSIVLNNVRLSTQSSVLFQASTSRGSPASDILASWEISCLKNEITLLSVRIDAVIGSTRYHQGSGFSASFKQGSAPTFLRFEQAPVRDLPNIDDERKWTKLQHDADYVVVGGPSMNDAKLPSDVQEQLRRLHEIKARMGRLQHQYMRQERRIFRMITREFHVCDGAACLFQTAIKKAPDFFELVKAHFKHRPDWTKLHGHRSHDHPSPPQFVEFGFKNDQPHRLDGPAGAFGSPEGASGHLEGPHTTDESNPPYFDLDMQGPPPPPLPTDEDEPASSHHHGPPHLRPHHKDCHHGPPSPPHFDEDGILLPPSPPCHHRGGPGIKDDGRPHRAGHHKPGHHPPHHFHPYGPHRHPFFFSLGTIFIFALVAALLFKCVRAKTGLFRNDQRQRDRAARREESCNRAAYRRAAFRHKWTSWWSQFRKPESTADYEEKRARLLGQEDALEDVMQSEIRDLRRAHELVGDMVRAEESRQRLYHEANFGSSSQAAFTGPLTRGQNTEDNQSNISALPLYQPPPPSYDQELEGELTVVDGFSYTPSATDSTPDSSVVDCNSRMSFETDTMITKA